MTDSERNDANFILVEFTPRPGLEEVSLSPADLAKKSAEALDSAMGIIRQMAQLMCSTIDKITELPTQVEMQFGLKLDAQMGAMIAKAGIESSINVKLAWDRKNKGHEQTTS